MMSKATAPQIAIRDLRSIDDLSQLKAVEKEVWGMAEEDTVPLTLAIALKAAGNIFVGAFANPEPKPEFKKDKQENKEQLVGFAFGFLAREHGQTTIHSHMLAVLDPYRHLDLGFRLKQAQRERALAQGIKEMTWTFDPLQSRNAHFNFAKLGVVSDTYKIDFYGPETSSILHRNGTDRLWVRWILNSRRVRDRGAGGPACKNVRVETLDALKLLAPLVRFDPSGKPARADLSKHRNPRRYSRGRTRRHGSSQRMARVNPLGLPRSPESRILCGRVLSFDTWPARPWSLPAAAWNNIRSNPGLRGSIKGSSRSTLCVRSLCRLRVPCGDLLT